MISHATDKQTPTAGAKKDYWVILILVAIACALRLWFVIKLHPPGDYISSDMWVHTSRAASMLSGKISPWDSFSAPGYAAFLAIIYYLTDYSYTAVGIVQSLMGGLTVALTYALAQRFTGSVWVARVSALLSALHAPLILYCGLILSESSFTFFVLLGLWSLFRALDHGRWRWFLLAGLVFGIATTIRPNLLITLPLLPFFVVLVIRNANKAAMVTVVLCVGLAIPIAAGSWFTSRALGKPTLLSTNGGLNAYLNFAEVRSIKYMKGGERYTVTPVPNLLRYKIVEHVNVPFYRSSHYYRRAVGQIRQNPRRLWRMFDNLKYGLGLEKHHYWPGWPAYDSWLYKYSTVFAVLFVVPAILFIPFSLISRWRRKQRGSLWPLLLLLAPLAGAMATIMLFLGDQRLRVPFDPVVIIFALGSYTYVFSALFKRKRAATLVPQASPLTTPQTHGPERHEQDVTPQEQVQNSEELD